MIWTTVLAYIWSSVKRVGMLVLGGPYTWIGITLYVVYANRAGFAEFFRTGDFLAVAYSFGRNLGSADKVVLENTRQILSLSASSTEFVFQLAGFQLFAVNTTLLTYLGLLGGIVGSGAYIIWYFKAFHKVSEWALAGNAPLLYTMVVAGVFYALTIALVRDVNPFVGVITFVQNVGDLTWSQVVNSSSTSLANNSSAALSNKFG